MDSTGYWSNSSLLSDYSQSTFFDNTSTQFAQGSIPMTLVNLPSPPWGLHGKATTVNTSFRLQPIATIPSSSQPSKLFMGSSKLHHQHGNGSIVLCQLIPVTVDSWIESRRRRLKRQRNEQIHSKRTAAVRKSYILASLKKKEIKRLQRGPVLKAKKHEIYEKWRCRKLRRKLRSEQRLNRSIINMMTNTTNNFPERDSPVSQFPCPLWWCNKKRQRRGHLESDNGNYCHSRRPSRPQSRVSRASNLSRRRSRSPIIIRNE